MFTVLAHNSAVSLRIALNVITVGVAIGTIISVVTVSVIVVKTLPGSNTGGNPFVNEKVVLVQTGSLIAINRDIDITETDYYYNATQSLETLVEELNMLLERTFSSNYIKIIVSDLSPRPILQNNETGQSTPDICSSDNNLGGNTYGCTKTQLPSPSEDTASKAFSTTTIIYTSSTSTATPHSVPSVTITSKKPTSNRGSTSNAVSTTRTIDIPSSSNATPKSSSQTKITSILSTSDSALNTSPLTTIESSSEDSSISVLTTTNVIAETAIITSSELPSSTSTFDETSSIDMLSSAATYRDVSDDISLSVMTERSTTEDSLLSSQSSQIYDESSSSKATQPSSATTYLRDETSSTESTATSYSTYTSSLNIISTLSSLFSSFMSTISTPVQITTSSITASGSTIADKCNILNYNSIQPSLIFLNVTMYFNNTSKQNITRENIINALRSYAPLVVLITTCGTQSSDEGSFNVSRSIIEPLTTSSISLSDLLEQESIPNSLITEMTINTPPPILNSTNATTLSVTITTSVIQTRANISTSPVSVTSIHTTTIMRQSIKLSR
jgi:antigen KI-67